VHLRQRQEIQEVLRGCRGRLTHHGGSHPRGHAPAPRVCDPPRRATLRPVGARPAREPSGLPGRMRPCARSRRAVATGEGNTRSVAMTAGLMPCVASFAVASLRVRAQGALLRPRSEAAGRRPEAGDRRPETGGRRRALNARLKTSHPRQFAKTKKNLPVAGEVFSFQASADREDQNWYFADTLSRLPLSSFWPTRRSPVASVTPPMCALFTKMWA
jgi:hypothetical protein